MSEEFSRGKFGNLIADEVDHLGHAPPAGGEELGAGGVGFGGVEVGHNGAEFLDFDKFFAEFAVGFFAGDSARDALVFFQGLHSHWDEEAIDGFGGRFVVGFGGVLIGGVVGGCVVVEDPIVAVLRREDSGVGYAAEGFGDGVGHAVDEVVVAHVVDLGWV